MHMQVKAELWKFPDRQTSTGKLIDSYLNNREELDDAAVHLLYSANRWEKRCALAAFELLMLLVFYQQRNLCADIRSSAETRC